MIDFWDYDCEGRNKVMEWNIAYLTIIRAIIVSHSPCPHLLYITHYFTKSVQIYTDQIHWKCDFYTPCAIGFTIILYSLHIYTNASSHNFFLIVIICLFNWILHLSWLIFWKIWHHVTCFSLIKYKWFLFIRVISDYIAAWYLND